MDLTGVACGVFEVWGPIGEGGMSRVWLARHRELSSPVVLKTLLDGAHPDEAFTRLRNEARLTARIPDPRVVRAVDVGIHGGVPYLAEEYVDGLDLAELAERRRAALGRGLPLWFVALAVRDVASALLSAHQTGVLHRDVKPSNLFGSPQTGVRLGDFGVAVGQGRARVAAGGGTPRFIAPEALRGEAPTRRCDVYSLGATAYDLYYGRPPLVELKDILGDGEVQFPAARTPEEAYFQHFLARMLERSPSRRLSSPVTLIRKLGALARDLRPAPPVAQIERGALQVGPVRIRCILGDIAQASADGIVNSANDEMKMRSGVGGSLRRRGGQRIEDEAMRDGRRALGECIATGAGDLGCRYVLHAVSAWNEASCIARATQRALLLAEELGLRTLAIPALGTGVARVPPEASAYAAGAALHEHLLLGGSRLREVTFVLYDAETLDIFVEQLAGLFLGGAEQGEDDAAPRAGRGARDEDALADTVLLRGGVE